jgi:hypothetical protein
VLRIGDEEMRRRRKKYDAPGIAARLRWEAGRPLTAAGWRFLVEWSETFLGPNPNPGREYVGDTEQIDRETGSAWSGSVLR